jgi:hypothetical protein
MRQQTNYQQWDPEDVSVGSGGQEVTKRDDEWERDVRHWDSRGVPDDLLVLARPLMEGTPRQRSKAERILTRAENTFQMRDNDRKAMAKLLVEHGLLGEAESVKAGVTEGLLRAWEKHGTPASGDESDDGTGDLVDAWRSQYGDA